ncbi:kelch repeats protein [Diplodia corticola]|uniref:Kelch repeats protein n=1 Tax=Diplodia corticola TaxID=236234 RepID=A0A1J9RZ07_9PEZI|nr:kelch repeats protein [Diplodia corticola]OJD37907.1 kelch repeats protein [Diplodia corticola]
MAKKADKAKKAEKKARTAAKQEKKAGKKESKNQKRAKDGDDSDADDVDIDAVLAEYARQQEQFLKVTEAVVDPPSARASATLIGSPTNDNELFLFGGEYFNGALAHFYNDLFVYNIHRDEWRRVTSPNTPLPRSGHAWTRGGNDKAIYLFGGEFSSPKQGTFYHYNDLWRLEPSSREWMRLESKGKGPPARSGHRMTYFKNYIILFGGFQDTSQQTRYLNDVWIYDTATYAWHEPKLPSVGQRPDPRSSFSFLPSDAGAVLYGGYSRVKQAAKGGGSGKGGPASRNVLKPVVHQDTWFLRIVPPAADASASLPKVHWERRKKAANPPNPPRAGATMAFHKGRGILFGGVHDVEESEEGIDSEFFNQLFAWNIDRNRYFPLALRKPRAQGKKQGNAGGDRGGGRRGRGKADEEELLRNLKALEMRGTLAGADDDGDDGAELPARLDGAAREDDEDEKPDRAPKPVQFEMPHPRFNAALAVQDDVLYVFGGTFEKADREFTFDEMWAIDLGKLEGVKEIFRRELEDWQGEESEDEDEDEEDEEDEDEEDEGSDDDDVASTAATSVSAAPSAKDAEENATAEEKHKSASALTEDGLPHPRPFETLRDFYARSTNDWQNVIIDELSRKYGGEAKLPKEIKTMAFERAEEKWWDCREEIRALEDEQEQAGISEVVSLAERGDAATGGAGRRR